MPASGFGTSPFDERTKLESQDAGAVVARVANRDRWFAVPATAQTEIKPPATYPDLPSEMPAKFKPKNESFDYSRRKVMIPICATASSSIPSSWFQRAPKGRRFS
jgi:hypothetical protein